MNTTLEREPRLAADGTPLAAGVTPLASPAFSAPAHSAAQVSDSDDPATVLDESLSARAERPHPIPHVAPHG